MERSKGDTQATTLANGLSATHPCTGGDIRNTWANVTANACLYPTDPDSSVDGPSERRHGGERLLRGHASVNGVDAAGGPGGFIRRQVEHQVGHFIRGSWTAHGIRRQHLFAAYGIVQ